MARRFFRNRDLNRSPKGRMGRKPPRLSVAKRLSKQSIRHLLIEVSVSLQTCRGDLRNWLGSVFSNLHSLGFSSCLLIITLPNSCRYDIASQGQAILKVGVEISIHEVFCSPYFTSKRRAAFYIKLLYMVSFPLIISWSPPSFRPAVEWEAGTAKGQRAISSMESTLISNLISTLISTLTDSKYQ